MLGWNDLEKWREKNRPPGVTFHCATYLISLHLLRKGISLQIFGSYLRGTNPLCLDRVAMEVLHWEMQPRPHEHLLRPPTAKNEDVLKN